MAKEVETVLSKRHPGSKGESLDNRAAGKPPPGGILLQRFSVHLGLIRVHVPREGHLGKYETKSVGMENSLDKAVLSVLKGLCRHNQSRLSTGHVICVLV